jgi:hypothetical protein
VPSNTISSIAARREVCVRRIRDEGWKLVDEYLNVCAPIGSRQVAHIVPNPEPAPLVDAVFDLYATGERTVERLTDEMTHRGLRNRGRGGQHLATAVTVSGPARLLGHRGAAVVPSSSSPTSGRRHTSAVGNTGHTAAVAKVMVSLPDDLLRAVDMEAGRLGTTRRGYLGELAEEMLRRRSTHRAQRMTEIDTVDGPVTGHGGGVAALVKENRPEP